MAKDDSWDNTAVHYAKVVDAVTAQAADEVIRRAASLRPFDDSKVVPEPTKILDNGCGTGSVVKRLKAFVPSAPIVAVDLSHKMIEILEEMAIPNVHTYKADAQDLSELGRDGLDSTYSHALSTFTIQFVDDPIQALREMHRVLQPGGIIGIALWGQNDPWDLFDDAAASLDPAIFSKSPYDRSFMRSEVDRIEVLKRLGFEDIEVWDVSITFGENSAAVVEYWFEGHNPGIEVLLEPWRTAGRIPEVKAEAQRIYKERGNPNLKSLALCAVARKV